MNLITLSIERSLGTRSRSTGTVPALFIKFVEFMHGLRCAKRTTYPIRRNVKLPQVIVCTFIYKEGTSG